MTSSLTWLDYSEKERQQVAEVISLFGEETARDELGIGVIRDTFSNALFPATAWSSDSPARRTSSNTSSSDSPTTKSKTTSTTSKST